MGSIVLNLLSFVVGVFGALFAMRFGDRIGINDIPNGRSSHYQVVPKGAGLGILFAFILASLFLSISMNLWLPALLIALVSLWGGDKHLLSVKERLVFQFGCSLLFILFFFYSKQFALKSYFLVVPISVFIVGTSNFYNFMDGIDGIAGVTAVVGFWLLSLYNDWFGSEQAYSAFCIALVWASIGFLCFNLPRAKVFLGDVGSVLFGFVFACMVVMLAESLTDFIVLAGFLAPFYADELSTMCVRIKKGESLLIAHRKHIYQVLANEGGISHWKVSLGYGFFQLIIGLSGIALKPKGFLFVVLAYLAYGGLFIIFSIAVRKRFSIDEH